MKELKTLWAVHSSGEVVSVHEAVQGEQYTCLDCAEALLLRCSDIGKEYKKIKHFAHQSDTKCTGESVIHRACKVALGQDKTVMFPNGDVMVFDSVEFETEYGGIIPDAIGYIGGVKYFVEFAYTHFCGEQKIRKIEKMNVQAVEITVRDFESFGALRQFISSDMEWRTILRVGEDKDAQIAALIKRIIGLEEYDKKREQKICEMESSLPDIDGVTLFLKDGKYGQFWSADMGEYYINGSQHGKTLTLKTKRK